MILGTLPCKYESCSLKVAAIFNLSFFFRVSLIGFLFLIEILATMDHKEEHQPGATSLNNEELPQMDGSCDACEPDEAQMATLVCHKCSFAFCPLHAERHVISTRHPLAPYNHDNTPVNGLGSIKDNSFGGGADGEAGMGGNQRVVGADAGFNRLLSGLEMEPVVGEGPVSAEAGQEVSVSADQKKDTVTVERLRCVEHEQEGSLYCKMDEKIICVVCAVQGEHRAHEIITLQEAYLWQKVRNTVITHTSLIQYYTISKSPSHSEHSNITQPPTTPSLIKRFNYMET